MHVAVRDGRGAPGRAVVRADKNSGETSAGDFQVVQREVHDRGRRIRLEPGGDDVIRGNRLDNLRRRAGANDSDVAPVVADLKIGEYANGRYLDYKDKPERQLCRLFLSLMDKMDLHPETFGDAKTMLEEV